MNQTGIGTGRTHRMLLAALAAATRGCEVRVFGHSMEFARHLTAQTAQILQDEGAAFRRVSANRIELTDTPGGTINFTATSLFDAPAAMRGRNELVFADHYVRDLALRRLREIAEAWTATKDGR